MGSWRRAKLLRTSALLVSLIFSQGIARAEEPFEQQPATAPSFEAAYLDRSGGLRLSDLKGKVVLINFWASWCAPCLYEMPHFQTLYDHFGRDDFEIVAINTMDERARAKAFLNDHRFSYHLVFDEGDEIAKSYGVTGPPQTFILNRDGAFVPIPDPKGGASKRAVYDPTIWAHPKTAAFLESLIRRE